MIREATLEDAKDIAKIIFESWKVTYRGIISDEYLDNMSFEERINKWKRMLSDERKSYTKVSIQDGVINGVIRFGNSEDMVENCTGEIYALYVDINKKRNGIGKSLFECAKNILKEKHKNVILWCAKENYPSIEFYKKMGGEIITERTIKIDNVSIEEVGIIYKF